MNMWSTSRSFESDLVSFCPFEELHANADYCLDSRQVLEGSFVDIKSTGVRDVLREVLEGVICVSLREDRPSVSTSLRVVATSDSYNILRRSIRMSCSPTYLS